MKRVHCIVDTLENLNRSLEGTDELKMVLDDVLDASGVDRNKQIFYTKQIAYTVGEKIAANIREGHHYYGSLRSAYETVLTRSLREIYAEMTRLSLTPADLFSDQPDTVAAVHATQGNNDIVAGIEKVIATITGRHDATLSDTHTRIRTISQNTPSPLLTATPEALPPAPENLSPRDQFSVKFYNQRIQRILRQEI